MRAKCRSVLLSSFALSSLFLAGIARADAPAPTSSPSASTASAPNATSAPAPATPPSIDQVQVKADPADTLEHASGSGSVVSPKEIARAQPQSTGEVLRRVPGLVILPEDGNGLRLNIGVRGMNPTRGRLVLVEEDGVPVVVSPYGEPELYYTTPVERISYIDVKKGYDILLNGPQTVGGVIQFHTWEPPTRREWSVEAVAGTGFYEKVLARYGDASGDVRYLVQTFHKQGDGFVNMPFNQDDVMAKVAFPTGAHGEATLKLIAYHEFSNSTYVGLTQGMFDADPRSKTVAPNDTFGITRYEASLTHDQTLSPSVTLHSIAFAYTMNVDFRQQDFDRAAQPANGGGCNLSGYVNVVGPPGLTPAGSQCNDAFIYFKETATLNQRNYNVAGLQSSLTSTFDTGDVHHKVLAGARIMVDDATRDQLQAPTPTSNVGNLLADSTTDILGIAAFAQDRIAFSSKLLLIPTARFEHSESTLIERRVYDGTTSTDVDTRGHSASTGFTPGIGMVYGIPTLNAFGDVHLGYSPPRVAQAITPTGQDAQLDAERSVNYEIGSRAKVGRWLTGELVGFLTSFDNQLISNNTLSGSTAEFVNGGATRHYGGEITAVAQLGKALKLPLEIDLAAHYTYAHVTFSDGPNKGNFVPYSPQNVLSTTLDLEHRSGFGAQASFMYIGEQFASELNTVDPDVSGRDGLIPAYTALDFGLRYRHAPSGIGVSLSIKNALDDIYIASRQPNGIFTGGYRQVMAGLKWSGP